MDKAALKTTADNLVKSGKGILAADESTGTAGKRLASIGMENTEDNRRAMRDLFFSTSGAAEYISGVILFDETLRQKRLDGKMTFATDMMAHGVIPGIKVDQGLEDAFKPGEKVTNGLDGLPERLAEYFELGARFAKWRSVFSITDTLPSAECVEENCDRLARYAKMCQQAGIVPIVEPEMLMDASGAAHTIDQAYAATTRVHKALFAKLKEHDVYLEGVLLKPSMVIEGHVCDVCATTQQVAEMTVKCLKESVPADVAGVVFLSGGQTDIQATEHLNLMNKLDGDLPWPLSFSYGRALQGAALQAWGGRDDAVENARATFLHRAKMNSLATKGLYTADKEDGLCLGKCACA